MVKYMPIVHLYKRKYVVYILQGYIYNGQHSHIKYKCIASIYMPFICSGFLNKAWSLGDPRGNNQSQLPVPYKLNVVLL